MSQERHFTAKHSVFLLMWWLSMGYTLASNKIWLGIIFIIGFFFVSTFKTMGKSIIFMAATFILTMIFPPLAAVIAVLSVVFMFLRIRFLLKNWRALAVGIYAYFVYLLVVLLNSFFANLIVVQIASLIAVIFLDNNAVQYGSTAFTLAAYLTALIFTIIFHRLLKWLYRHGYGTDRAFQVMGLTPLILIAIILPFLKIKINGHELFSGSLSDNLGDIDTSVSIDADLPDLSDATDLPVPIDAALDLADVDLISMFNVDTATTSPALEASFAIAAARGVFKVSDYAKEYTIRNENGSTETVSFVDETHALISAASGQRLGYITLDPNTGRELVKLTNGFTYTFDPQSGNITDADGKLIGKLRDGVDGSKVLLNGRGALVREFRSDGSVVDDNEHVTSIVTA